MTGGNVHIDFFPSCNRGWNHCRSAHFRANMRLDNLPGAELVVYRDQKTKEEFVSYRFASLGQATVHSTWIGVCATHAWGPVDLD